MSERFTGKTDTRKWGRVPVQSVNRSVFRPTEADRAAYVIYAKTLLISVCYIGAVWSFYLWLKTLYRQPDFLLLVFSFTVVQLSAITTMMTLLIYLKASHHAKLRLTEQIMPLAQEQLAIECAMPSENPGELSPQLRELHRVHPDILEECFLELFPTLRIDSRKRLSEMATQLGYVNRWKSACTARSTARRSKAVLALGMVANQSTKDIWRILSASLSDPDELVRVTAARALIQSGNAREIERALHRAITQSLLVRALLGEDLRKHAGLLAERAIPAVFESGNAKHIRATLEIVATWRRTISIPGIASLLSSSDPAIRGTALRALPFVSESYQMEAEILNALDDDHAEVRAAAAEAISRLGFSSSLSTLARHVSDPEPSSALACAIAMAKLGEEGQQQLAKEVLQPKGNARVAMEALERAQLGRLEN